MSHVKYKMAKKQNAILIAGGTGLVGSRLSNLLINKGYTIHILSRSKRKKNTQQIKYFHWDIDSGTIDLDALQVDHIINLAGAGIADKRWTTQRKREILESRTKSTHLIHRAVRETQIPISHYIGASAIGIYGDSAKSKLTETEVSADDDFMVEVCRKWENAHLQLKTLCEHVSILRIGIVLSTKGGALKEILKPLTLGRLGTYFGDGKMIYSWIHIDDLVNMCTSLIDQSIKADIYNAVSPNPVTNKELVEKIMEVKNITALKLPAPGFMMKLLLGEMSNTILNSTSVDSQKIEGAGFTFAYPQLAGALSDILSTNK